MEGEVEGEEGPEGGETVKANVSPEADGDDSQKGERCEGHRVLFGVGE